MTASVRFVAIGDSFTEGVGDHYPDGTERGWADLVALGWADATGEAIQYANLAIRGRLIWQIVEEQLEPALALRPTHLSFVGGGNDLLRYGRKVEDVAEAFTKVLQRCDEEGVQLITHTGANPSARLPLSDWIQKRGTQLSEAVVQRMAGRPDVHLAKHWCDEVLAGQDFWTEDRLHMNQWGHHRVAARVLTCLGMEAPDSWWSPSVPVPPPNLTGPAFYWAHVLPWVRRRLTGRSSGDSRVPKFSEWTTIAPASSDPDRPGFQSRLPDPSQLKG